MQSYLLRQERCPKCAESGRDVSKDNLAVYSDGHCYCYGCGYFVSGSKVTAFKQRQQPIEEKHLVVLPQDSDTSYPQRALDWIRQYELDTNDLLCNNVLWSVSMQRLIFPIYSNEGLLAWQGRYFGNEQKAKWFSRGDLKNIFHILGTGDKLVLVEDIVSAIKVSRYYQAMPIFGSHIGQERFKRILSLFGYKYEVCIWLDPDKRKESIVEARRGILAGLDVRVIYAEKDPKEIPFNQLKEILNG